MKSLILLFLLAIPTVENVTLQPPEPSPKGTISFSASISGEDIEEVRLIVRECKEDFCFAKEFNESMYLSDGLYKCQITLRYEEATYIQYNLEIKSKGTWYKSDIRRVNLSHESKTPGFQAFFLFLAVLFLILKKRAK
jgi:hypothetical protein